MRLLLAFALAGLLAAASIGAPSAAAAAVHGSRAGAVRAPDRVLVGFARGVGADRRSAIVRASGARQIGIVGARTHILRVPGGRVGAVVAALRRTRGVRYAEPDFILRLTATPNDPAFPVEWWASNGGQAVNGVTGTAGADVGVLPAWDRTVGSGGKIVAVLDSGVDYTHPDLATRMWSNPGIGGCPPGTHGFNVLSASAPCDPMDDDTTTPSHGTRVAGLVAAAGNDGIGITGVGWQIPIMAVKWTNSQAFGSNSQLLAAIDRVIGASPAGADVRVINVSGTFVGTPSSDALRDEIERAGAAGILFVTAAGNTKQNNDDPATPRFPCDYRASNEICVGASDQNDQLAAFSNFGPGSVDLAAPGVNMYSTVAGGGYAFDSGTSYAAPLVAGAAALSLGAQDASVAELKARILAAVDVLPSLAGKVRTGGRLDVCKVVPGCNPLSLAVTVPRRMRLGPALRRGITATVQVNAPAQLRMRVSLAPAVARRLGVPAGARVVTRGARVARAASVQVRARFSRRARVRLASARRIPMTVQIRAVDAEGHRRTATSRVLLHR